MLSTIDLFYEPRKLCLSEYNWPEGEPEMTEFESAFLCGLIKLRKPRKIVEVGVAAGGTTSIMLKCLELLEIEGNSEMFSVDISMEYYRGKDKRCGYLADDIIVLNGSKIKHIFMLGKMLPEVIDEIGDGIDFVILDTRHVLPGEILDFLAIYPYLKQDACVVLHDIALNHYGQKNLQSYATQVLFDCVVADKFIIPDESRPLRYPNIGAFLINDETTKHIEDVFNSLLITWQYILNEHDFVIYLDHYTRHYGKPIGSLFSTIFELQKDTHEMVLRRKQQMVSRKSITYRVGSVLTWIPRNLLHAFASFNKSKENGK